MEFIDINPFVRLAEKIVYMPPQNFIFKAYDCRLLYIIEGTGTLCLNDIDHSFSQNDMFYFKEATSYSFTCTGELMLYVFNFDMGQSNSDYKHIVSPSSELKFDEANILSHTFFPIPKTSTSLL